MIVVDTSAFMAIVLNEPQADACLDALVTEDALLVSAVTVVEAVVVSARRDLDVEIARLIAELGFEVVPVTSASAPRVAEAYARWGKGIHPGSLNFGDCFAYELGDVGRLSIALCGRRFCQDGCAKRSVSRRVGRLHRLRGSDRSGRPLLLRAGAEPHPRRLRLDRRDAGRRWIFRVARAVTPSA